MGLELSQAQKVLIKHFLARWAPYTTWWHWTVDGEYDEVTDALPFQRVYAGELRRVEPWKTLLTTHVSGNWSPQGSPEFDFATLQRRVVDSRAGVTACRSFVLANDHHKRPVYNAEGVWNLETTERSRVATLTHLFSGGFSNIAHWPRSTGDPSAQHELGSSWQVTWPADANARGVTFRHREDAELLGTLTRFFNNTPGIDISRCVPRHDLTEQVGGHLDFCLAEKAGKHYYVWLDEGGAPSIDLTGRSGTYQVFRYRGSGLEVGKQTALATIQGGGRRFLEPTPTTGFGQDYLYAIVRAPTPPVSPPPAPPTPAPTPPVSPPPAPPTPSTAVVLQVESMTLTHYERDPDMPSVVRLTNHRTPGTAQVRLREDLGSLPRHSSHCGGERRCASNANSNWRSVLCAELRPGGNSHPVPTQGTQRRRSGGCLQQGRPCHRNRILGRWREGTSGLDSTRSPGDDLKSRRRVRRTQWPNRVGGRTL